MVDFIVLLNQMMIVLWQLYMYFTIIMGSQNAERQPRNKIYFASIVLCILVLLYLDNSM